jgi:hypothetical protein
MNRPARVKHHALVARVDGGVDSLLVTGQLDMAQSGGALPSIEVELAAGQLGDEGLRLVVNDDGTGQRRQHECDDSDGSIAFGRSCVPESRVRRDLVACGRAGRQRGAAHGSTSGHQDPYGPPSGSWGRYRVEMEAAGVRRPRRRRGR